MRDRTNIKRGERGQATVEFALVLPLLLLVVLGIADFGRALNYYNTLTELAADGARFAAVNQNPDGTAPTAGSIQSQVKAQAISNELTSSSSYKICIPSTGVPSAVGQPVTVQARYDFAFLPFLGFATLKLRGSATMRSEVPATYSAGPFPACNGT